MRAHALIRAFRERGHLEADLDPLRLAKPEAHADLDPASYGFTEDDLDRDIYMPVFGQNNCNVKNIC